MTEPQNQERASSEADSPSPTQAPYARKATGMVREIPFIDLLAFNAASTGGIGIALGIVLFFAFGAYPGANLIVALLIAIALVGFVWVTWALMASAFPKTGGDYLYGTRVIHPVVGIASNLGTFASTILATGLYGVFFTTVGLAPALSIIGVTTGSDWWVDAAATVSQKGWQLFFGALAIGFIAALSLYRTRVVTRTIAWCFAIGFAGFVVAFLILLFTSRDTFTSTINEFSQPFTNKEDTYQATIEAGRDGGLVYPSDAGYSTRSTIGALFPAINVLIWTYWGVYLAGEFKGGGRRRRQLGAMLGAGYAQGLLILVATIVFLNTAGYNFFAAANNGFYDVPVSTYYTFFASVIAGSDVLSLLLAMSFVFFVLPGLYINFAMCQRALFAWSFDGIAPRQLASVSPKTHTPVVAIATVFTGAVAASAWLIYGSNVFEILTITAGLLCLPIVTTGVSGFLIARRLPHVYESSPANWRIKGVPVLPITSVGCTLIGIGYLVLLTVFYRENGVSSQIILPSLPLACLAVAAAYYFTLRGIQRSRGVNLDYVYRTIPPD